MATWPQLLRPVPHGGSWRRFGDVRKPSSCGWFTAGLTARAAGGTTSLGTPWTPEGKLSREHGSAPAVASAARRYKLGSGTRGIFRSGA